jgi:hypothetical protein
MMSKFPGSKGYFNKDDPTRLVFKKAGEEE